jgi:protein-S-isoprenylcysteine O-methyltransferase Ste14
MDLDAEEVTAMRWSWGNVPVPPQHVVGLTLGALLHFAFRQRILPRRRIGVTAGLPLIAMGVGLSAWSVAEAGATDVESPDRLLTGGPYSLSRNPMYVAWSLMHVGIALAVDSLWMIALTPAVASYTHLVDVRGEERALEQRFGDEYAHYRRRVRRYV